jgi:hypothetical protein
MQVYDLGHRCPLNRLGEASSKRGSPTAKLDARNSGTFKIGGDIEIYRLGSGAMRITGEGI